MDSIIIFSVLGIVLLVFLSQHEFIKLWKEQAIDRPKEEAMTREYFEGLDTQIETEYAKTNILREF